MTTIQRLIFPQDQDPDVLPLYAEGELSNRLSERDAMRPGNSNSDFHGLEAIRAQGQSASQILSRLSYRVPAHTRTSFGTYFNAFPAAYWAAHTTVREVELVIQAHGVGSVIVSRSSARGERYRIHAARIDDPESTEVRFTLPLDTFGDGGWYWWDAVAYDEDVVIEGAQWVVADELPEGKATIAITTFNRPTDCAEMLRQLSTSDVLFDYVKQIVVVDQGNNKVAATDGFDHLKEYFGDRLRIIDQMNLGGSGGFSRGMIEAVANDSDYVMLLDDDVRVEPDGICRAVAFANATKEPMIVGGHMFSMYQRTQLHAFAEDVNPHNFWWGSTFGTFPGHDFAVEPLRTTMWMHERAEAGYNGWWMCLIPTSVVKKIGLSLPLFIKWDDSEFGLRAKESGVRTVSLPGAALWHVPWTAKEDSLDWQAYFHYRNRLVAALLHSPHPHGGRLLFDLFRGSVKHLVSAQYSVVALIMQAIRDIESGPEHLHATMATKIPEIREMRSQFTDAQVKPRRDDFPTPAAGVISGSMVALGEEGQKKQRIKKRIKALLHQVKPQHAEAHERPDVIVTFPAAKWWTLSALDSALVSNSDGSGFSFYKRDRDYAKDRLFELAQMFRTLHQHWPELAQQYRASLDDLVSPQQWAQTIGIDAPSWHIDHDDAEAAASQPVDEVVDAS